jgi:hypothetical protein
MTVNNNSTSRYTDTSTSDIGDTTPVDFSTSISGNNLLLTANIASGTWYVRLNYRRFYNMAQSFDYIIRKGNVWYRY